MVAGNIGSSGGDRFFQQNQVITVKAAHHRDTEFGENKSGLSVSAVNAIFLIHSSDANAIRLQPRAEAGNTPR
jgi:hypothetical protein